MYVRETGRCSGGRVSRGAAAIVIVPGFCRSGDGEPYVAPSEAANSRSPRTRVTARSSGHFTIR